MSSAQDSILMPAQIRNPKMILIDVDGTLVDSVPDLAYCVDEMMTQMNMPIRGEKAVRNWVGNGVERLVRRALINQLDGEPEDVVQIAADYAPEGIVCNAVAPGKIMTGMGGREPTDAQLGYSKSRTPWPRLGQAEDVASAALFLASAEATYITGENLMVDGGWMAS